ncbi:MAG TPA: SDR family oxidoreductase [Vicinamibacterales bacterium]
MRILVTGATGFVGTALLRQLIADGRSVARATVRLEANALPAGIERVVAGDLDDLNRGADWRPALAGMDAVVHLAARVHVMREAVDDPLTAFRRINVAATLALARQAAAAGVRRFVYLSSIKVNGEAGVYTDHDPPAPADAYGISKHEAELGLRQLAHDTGLEVVIIRPPLVYGPGVRANFLSLMRAVARGIPLPLGAVHNRRSLVALGNLVDFIMICLEHPAAANELFLVSDGEDLSTTDLIRRLARAMDRPARLIPVPSPLLMAAATLLGKRDVATRLLGSLQVDISKARRVLHWAPPISVDEGLKRAVAAL